MSKPIISISCALFFALAYQTPGEEPVSLRTAVETYCTKCHDADAPKGDLNLTSALSKDVDHHPEIWEKVIRRLRGRQMPPLGKKRPDEATYNSTVSQL